MIDPHDGESDATHSFNPEHDLQPVMFALNWYVDACHGLVDVPMQAMPHLQHMTAACLSLCHYLEAQNDTARPAPAADARECPAPQAQAARTLGERCGLDAAIGELTEQLEGSLAMAETLLERTRLWLGANHPLTGQAWRCLSLAEEATIFGGHELRALFDTFATCGTDADIPRQRH